MIIVIINSFIIIVLFFGGMEVKYLWVLKDFIVFYGIMGIFILEFYICICFEKCKMNIFICFFLSLLCSFYMKKFIREFFKYRYC